MSKARKCSLIFAVCALIFFVCGLMAWKAVPAYADEITMEDARASSAENLVAKETPTAGSEMRDGNDHGVIYDDREISFSGTGAGAWARVAKPLQSSYLNSDRATQGGGEVSTGQVTAYLKATVNFSTAPEGMTIGLLFGKRVGDTTTRYYALTLGPQQNAVFIYSFDVGANNLYIGSGEMQGAIATGKTYAVNTDYTLEVLMHAGASVDVWVDNETILSGSVENPENHESITGLVPVIGVFWGDLSGTVSDFTLKYLDAEVIPVQTPGPEPQGITIEDARASDAEDLVAAEAPTASANLREGNQWNITYADGTFTAVEGAAAPQQRSANQLHNRYLDSETAMKGEDEVSTSAVTSYFTAKFNYSHTAQYATAGILFGKRAEGANTRYFGLAWSPSQGVFFVYTFDLNADGAFAGEKSGPIDYAAKTYTENTDYKVELLLKTDGSISVYVDEDAIVTDLKQVYESNETLTGLTPIVGLSWFDITATVSDLTLQYLDAEVVPVEVPEPDPEPQGITIEEARASEAPDLVGLADVTVSGNLREPYPHTVTYENGVFGATTSGSATSRAAMLLHSRYLDPEVASKDDAEVPTSAVTSYLTAKFNYTASPSNTTIGVVFGRGELDNGYRYYALVVSPTQQRIFIYTFDVTAQGAFVAEDQGSLVGTSYTFEENTDYTLEILMNPGHGISVYLDGEEVVTGCKATVDGVNGIINIPDVTPVIGLSWFDISATLSDLTLKYLDAEAIPDPVPEPEEPDDDEPEDPGETEDPGINTDPIIPEVDRPAQQGCGSVVGVSSFAVLLAAGLAVFRRKRQ